ncbi:ABC-type oligopeptide transporter ABCB9 [Hydra vulgaris]|uniref:ABC-type oligopeptide transporter ABCB9 n=1 Tax=Hydra vulgaris TaxID=6087 RepID=A0ABM4CZ76_HYDVU
MNRFFTIAFVIFYIVADLTVNIFFNVWSNDISNSIFKFSIGHSTFDLLILSGLRFCILFGASIGLCCNYVLGVDRIKKWSIYVLYYSCFTALYTVVKIIYFLEDDLKNKWKMWIAISITISSVFFTYINWFFLGLKFNKKSKNNEETEVHMQSNSKEYIKRNKQNNLNVLDEMEAKKYSTSKTLLKLLKLAKYDTFYICVAFLFLILCSIGQVFLPFYTGLVLNYIIIDKSIQKFQDAILHLALVTLATGFAAGIRAGVFTFVLSRYVLRIQNLLFSAIVKMEIAFFDERNTGEITSRLTSDCTKIGDCVGLNVNIFTRNCVKVIGILFFMFKLSWKLSLLTLVSLPIVAIVSEIFGQRYRKLSEGVQNSLANANECAQEVISSIRTVRSFAAENQEIARYSERLYVTYNLRKKESFLQTFYRWSLEVTDMATSLLILFFGGDLVIKGHLIGGHLVSFILYSMELANAFDEIGDVYTGLMEAVGAARNVFVYIDRKPKIISGNFKPISHLRGDVVFKNVFFSYPSRPDVDVLKNITFHAKAGEVCALVGASGGGKSSVVNLLEHFYEPSSGEIFLDGFKISSFDHEFLHSKLTLVQQEPVLFARSISENIVYGLSNNVDAEEIIKAAIMANANSFICDMPEKYETQTGEKGIQLSGGQKQRIAIARALIRNPSVLVLDEATSALDTESEYLVQQAINKNLNGRTVIIIAHRLSTVEKADNIFVFDKGTIVEEGTHAYLIKSNGVYAGLVKRQMLE